MEFEIQIEKQTTVKQKEIKDSDIFEAISLAKDFRDFAKDLKTNIGKPAASGLAAPQCGIDKRICVINNDGEWIAAINPLIVGVEGDPYESEEGCLSWPGKVIKASRHRNIEVKYTNADTGGFTHRKFEGFQAKIWQHEIDHLDGVEEKFFEKDYRTVKGVEKVGRNDKCPCGSDRKYKKCCLGKE